ncbi:cytochrome P450 [Saccharothrix yanglingensis]|uniref:Cytochrome P450 n=1 Tax=Saccharothrix yanglingensis TaxID=659496 RepID=A0ABU0WUZ0_9PSEU|nr:cytochrome P450 [Saccharothrix yanglingensis]MDQ2583587.1 cytochrome P450 [Saccharothrix yanglingensis]
MTAHGDQTRTENRGLVEMGSGHWLDALLGRTPRRPAALAAPPAGSALEPVPGDRGLPFIGMGVHTVRYGPAFLLALMRRHGPVSWWRAFGRKVVAVSGPEAVQVVLANRDKAFASGWPAVIGPWFDGGLLAMNAPGHLADRRLVQAAYGEEALDGYLRTMAEDVEERLDRWPVGRRFRLVDAARELSGQITTRAFLGVPHEGVGRKVVDAAEECIRAETALARVRVPGTLWHRAHRARTWLVRYLHQALPDARARAGEDFLSVLSRVDGFTDRQVALHALFTVIASHDTTTAATLASVYFLGKHPAWQERARAESAGVAPRDAAGVDRLTTLDLVVRESIRLVSPSPVLMRVAVKDTDVLGHHIPAGQLVSVCTGVNQLMPELWSRPDRFDPGRFDEDRAEDRGHRLAWAPFGWGAHKCIGMRLGMLKVKATVDALLRRYEWSYPESYEAPWRFTSLPAPADGLPTVLRRI